MLNCIKNFEIGMLTHYESFEILMKSIRIVILYPSTELNILFNVLNSLPRGIILSSIRGHIHKTTKCSLVNFRRNKSLSMIFSSV